MKSFRFLVSILIAVAIVSSTSLVALAKGNNPPASSRTEGWKTFVHPEFGFSITYPRHWSLKNNLSLEQPSGTVAIKNQSTRDFDTNRADTQKIEADTQKIEIGLHLVETQKDVGPREWMEAFSAADKRLRGIDEKIFILKDLVVDDFPSVYKAAQSPFTFYEVVKIKRGELIWFIWGNTDHRDSPVFRKIVSSFQWIHENDHMSFSAIGIDPTMKLDIERKSFAPLNEYASTISERDMSSMVVNGIPGTPAGYRIPFSGQRSITQGPYSFCYPGTHTGTSGKAIDFQMPEGTSIVNSSSGWIERNGWDDYGYGNLVGVQDSSGRIAFYGHLQSSTAKSVGSYISQGAWVGSSGNTGNSTGPHLHFHVRTGGGTPVDITGIPTMNFFNACTGTAWYTLYW